MTAADRAGTTGLLECSASGRLPAGTRLVEFVLSAAQPMGSTATGRSP